MYDFIFIGGGIASLYSAYKLLQLRPELHIVLLERNTRLGGKIFKELFENTKVVVGAGVLRYNKDIHAINLLDELNIKYIKDTHKKSNLLDYNINVKEIFQHIKSIFDKDKEKYILYTFKQFASNILGNKLYKQFTIASGFTDYDNQNVYDAIYLYGFDDNYNTNPVLFVDWELLINTLKTELNKFKNFSLHTNINVINCTSKQDIYNCKTNKKTYESKQVVSGVDITAFCKIFNKLPSNVLNIYKKIKGQPFLLLYAKFSKDSIEIIKNCIHGFTICAPPLHKIIPINPNDGIYLISYCDNKNAIKMKPFIKNKKYLEKLVEKTLNVENLKITKLHHYYWENGTHYYKPFEHLYSREDFYNRIRYPCKNLYVVGDMVSTKQGWINGTMETCIEVIKNIK